MLAASIERLANESRSWREAVDAVARTGRRAVIVTSDQENKIKSIQRIDNAIEWFLMGHDRLDKDYVSPMLIDTSFPGYSSFWNNFILSRIFDRSPEKIPNEPGLQAYRFHMGLDLNRIYRWARFIAGYPEDEYRHFFDLGLANGLRNYQIGRAHV